MEKKRKNTPFILCIGAMLLVAAALLVVWACKPGEAAPSTQTAMAAPRAQEPIVVTKETEKIVEVEVVKKVDISTVEEKLRNMSFLITQEYFFTDVIDYQSAKDLKIFGKAIATSVFKSGYMVQYDGTVSAGVDFSGVTVSRDEEMQVITVEVPAAVLYNTSIDFDSFMLITEKESAFNKLSAEDYNSGLQELVKKAEARAIERGILKDADMNARLLINGFVNSLLEGETYSVRVKTKEA